MEYSDGYLWESLPRHDPPPGRVPHAVEDEIRREQENRERFSGRGDPDLVPRSRRWTYALFSELQQAQWVFRPREEGGFSHYSLQLFWAALFERCAIGLFEQNSEIWGFGLILPAGLPMERPFELMGEAFFPRLEASFPVGLRWSTLDLHTPVHPAGATAACWAQSKTGATWGIVTAGHAVTGLRQGSAVPLANGQAGQLARSHHPPVDAAFVLTTPPLRQVAPLQTLQFPAAGLAVDVALQSGTAQRSVVGTMNTLGVLRTRHFAVLSYLDQPFVAGDSGALVSAYSQQGLGIYIGSMNTPQAHGIVGLVQNLEQAVYALDVDPYL